MNDSEKFAQLLGQLDLTPDNRLMLGTVPMVLMPRWFFVGIMKRVVQEAGAEIAAKVYSEAGWEGAYNWAKVQLSQGLEGRAVMGVGEGEFDAKGRVKIGTVTISKPEIQMGRKI